MLFRPQVINKRGSHLGILTMKKNSYMVPQLSSFLVYQIGTVDDNLFRNQRATHNRHFRKTLKFLIQGRDLKPPPKALLVKAECRFAIA